MSKILYRFAVIVSILIFICRFFLPNLFFLPAVSPLKLKTEAELSGYVTGLPTDQNNHAQFDFVSQEGQQFRLTWYGPRPLIQPGTGWRFFVKLKPLDKERSGDLYLLRRGYQGKGSVEPLKPWVRYFRVDHPDRLNSIRFELRRHLRYYANQAGVFDASHLLLALGIGDSSGLNGAMWKVLQETGTSHLVAISGLHIGLIGMLFYGLIRRGWSLSMTLSHRFAAQKAGAVGGFLGALGYGFISGLGIPAQRTLIMLGCGAMYRCLSQTGGSFKAWILAFVLCLDFQPWGIFSLSMWLSFLAVFSLIYLLSHRIRLKSGVMPHLKMQMALYFLLIPVTLYSFGVVSLVAFWVNLWAIPLVSFVVVPVLFLGMILMALPSALSILPSSCFYVAGKAALLWWWGLDYCAHLPYAALYFHSPSLKETIFAQVGLFWILAPRGFPGRWLGLICLGPFLRLVVHDLFFGATT